MPDWDIDPQGVHGVLTSTQEAAAPLEGWATGYQQHIGVSAPASAGTLYSPDAAPPGFPHGIVGAALAEFANATRADLEFVMGRVSASLMGAGLAAQAYVEGDLTMAQDATALALQEPTEETLRTLTDMSGANGENEGG